MHYNNDVDSLGGDIIIKEYINPPNEFYFSSISTFKSPILKRPDGHKIEVCLYEDRGDFAKELFDFFVNNNPLEFEYYSVIKKKYIILNIDEFERIFFNQFYIDFTFTHEMKDIAFRDGFKIFYGEIGSVTLKTEEGRVFL